MNALKAHANINLKLVQSSYSASVWMCPENNRELKELRYDIKANIFWDILYLVDW